MSEFKAVMLWLLIRDVIVEELLKVCMIKVSDVSDRCMGNA